MNPAHVPLLAMDIGDLAGSALLIIVVLSGLLGQVLAKKKAGERGAGKARRRPSAGPAPPPGAGQPSAKARDEEIVEIRLPTGELIARVRQPKKKPEPTPKPTPRARRQPPTARPPTVPERAPRPSRRPAQPTLKPTTEAPHGLRERLAGRTIGTEHLGDIGKEVKVSRLRKDTKLGRIGRARTEPVGQATKMIGREKLREAVILSEILRPPLALRDPPSPER